MKPLSQKEIDEIRNKYYNRDKLFERHMEEIKKVQLKGKAYPQNEYFFKKKHPYKWQWHQLLKRFFRVFGSEIKFTYPKDGPDIHNTNK